MVVYIRRLLIRWAKEIPYFNIVMISGALLSVLMLGVEIFVIQGALRLSEAAFLISIVLSVWGLLFRKKFSGRQRMSLSAAMVLTLSTAVFLSHGTLFNRREFESLHHLSKVSVLFYTLVILLGTFTWMGRSRDSEERISYQTGMRGQKWMENYVDERILQGCSRGYLVILDLKNFRIINTVYGREFGNRIIRRFGRALQHHEDDTLCSAHLTGVEFALWSEYEGDINIYLEALRDDLFDVFRREGGIYSLCLHSAFAVYPKHGDSFQRLYHRAAMAIDYPFFLKPRHIVYSASMEERIRNEADLFTDIQEALERNEFFLCYQEKRDRTVQRVMGLEALIRWESPSRGMIPPSEFLSVISRLNLTRRLTELVLDMAMSDLDRIDSLYGDQTEISVNIPPSCLYSSLFIDYVETLMNSHPSLTDRLIFEVIESVLLDDLDDVRENMRSLSRLGIKFSLDDFGTGYNSLLYINKLPFYELKIDRSFIDGINRSERDFVMVRCICEIARANGFRIVAEGVETEEQLHRLMELPCDLIQGFLYSIPSRLPLCSLV